MPYDKDDDEWKGTYQIPLSSAESSREPLQTGLFVRSEQIQTV